MQRYRSISWSLGMAFAVLTFSATGRAKESFSSPPSVATVPVDGGYGYWFADDAMQAGVFTPADPRIVVSTHVARVALIRPRTAFVAEMLKSVEIL